MDSNTRSVLDKVVKAAIHNGLVLFLGAGVNGGLYPRWAQLVEHLLNEAMRPYSKNKKCAKWLGNHRTENPEFDVYAQATLAKTLLGSSYTEVLRSQVYKRIKSAGERDTNVGKVAEFCCRPEVRAVVTYNYDTHLEDAHLRLLGSRRRRGQKNRGMTSVGLSSQQPYPLDHNDQLLVYHVHGLLAKPKDLHRRPDDPIVLTYDEYTSTMRDMCNWANATQLHFLRSRTCIFLGQSLSDWNVLRILEAAHISGSPPRHWLFTSSTESQNDFHFQAKATLLNSVGVQLAKMGDTFSEVYDILGKLSDLLRRRRELKI